MTVGNALIHAHFYLGINPVQSASLDLNQYVILPQIRKYYLQILCSQRRYRAAEMLSHMLLESRHQLLSAFWARNVR